MLDHGINVIQQETSVSTPIVAESGVPFVIGTAPIQSAGTPAIAGMPVLCTSWDEAVEALGYSDDWANYNLCEFMYSYFKLFACQPVIFLNLLDPATMKTAVSSASFTVTDHKAQLPLEAINNDALEVKAAVEALDKGTDYAVYYSGEHCIIELLPEGQAYSSATLSIAYEKATPASVDDAAVAAAIEKIELCLTLFRTIPDLIVAPGYSSNAATAAAMAAKAASINGLFTAKALIDIDAKTTTTYAAAVAKKATDGMTDKNQICCWPLATLGCRKFHLSTIVAGRMAQTDNDNGGNPSESPSNKAAHIDGLCTADGTAVQLTLLQAEVLNNGGIVTAINFINGWVVWGNYTACYPGNTDVKDVFIPVSRVFSWIGNTLIKTFWNKLDSKINRRKVDSILDSTNIWLNGITAQEVILGARVVMLDEENPLTSLLAGKIRLHIYMAAPPPLQQLDFVLEYDASYVETALQG